VSRLFKLVCVACLLVAGGVAHDDVIDAAQLLFAPAYDATTRSSMQDLTSAMESYALVEGDLDDVTVTELAGWGWEPADTTEVTIWVDGDQFRVVARDVRPGSSTFQVSSLDDATSIGVQRVGAPVVAVGADLEPEVKVVHAEL
jgi:hypothetical protein